MLLGREAFLQRFAEEFDLSVSYDELRQCRLHTDLAFDSIELLRATVFVEILVPDGVPHDLDYQALTVGDLYSLYCTAYADQDLKDVQEG